MVLVATENHGGFRLWSRKCAEAAPGPFEYTQKDPFGDDMWTKYAHAMRRMKTTILAKTLK